MILLLRMSIRDLTKGGFNYLFCGRPQIPTFLKLRTLTSQNVNTLSHATKNSYESQENPGQKISREISQRNPSETREIWGKSRQIQKILARSTFSEQDGFYGKNSLENSQLEKSNRVIVERLVKKSLTLRLSARIGFEHFGLWWRTDFHPLV